MGEIEVLDVNSTATLSEREEIIIQALDYSDRLRWRAFLELREIQKNKQYLEARYDDGLPVYPTWESYLEAFRERIPNTSRRLIFQRTGLLKKLNEGLGVPIEQITSHSPVKLEAITRLGAWDKKGNLLPLERGSVVDAEKMVSLVEETILQRTGDTLAMVDEMLGKSRILFYAMREWNGGQIVLTIKAVETKTGEVFHIKGIVSQPVLDELEKKLELQFEEGF